MPIRLRSWALCALVLVLDGCASVGPDYHPPEVPVPAAYPVVATAPDAHQSAADSQLLLGQWWTILGDQTLQILIDRAQSTGAMRSDVSADDIPMIMCGVSATMSVTEWDWHRHLELILDGLRSEARSASD